MRFKGMDLNLFVAFEALVETRSTARAAERIGLSQPAASAALSRLRDYFQDELLITKGRRMYPTPLAEALLPRIRACLQSANDVLASSSQFDPATTIRHFRIIASDYVIAAIFAPLCDRLATMAPGVTFQFILPSEHAAELLRRGEVDLLVTPSQFSATGLPTQPLFDERFVIAGAADHPLFAGPFTLDDLFDYGHVAVAVGGNATQSVGDRNLELLGLRRQVEITAPSFAVVPWLLLGTRRLALMHEQFARLSARQFGIAYAQIPVEFPPLRQLAHFHETRANDQGVHWLIDQINAQVAIPQPDRPAIAADAVGT